MASSPASTEPRKSCVATYEMAQERAAAQTICALAKSSSRARGHRGIVLPMQSSRHAKVAPEETSTHRTSPSQVRTLEDIAPPGAPEIEHCESQFESYQFIDEDSRLHLEFRSSQTSGRERLLSVVSALLVVLIGVVLACLAVAMVIATTALHTMRIYVVERALWAACEADGAAPCAAGPSARSVAWAGGIFVAAGLLLVLGAVCLTLYEPRTFGSGLPRLKAFLNGCHVDILGPRVLFTKVVGTCLVVSSGLPLGREGPMVHVGATVASIISRLEFGPLRPLLELRMPGAHRSWVAVGAAAGIAAAFHSPLGGILYAFEEVCSHWSARLTWRSFLVVVIVVAIYKLLIESASVPWLHVESFVIGGTAENIFDVSVTGGALGWAAVLGVLGGVIGAVYNRSVFALTALRARLSSSPRFATRRRAFAVTDATLTATAVLLASFAAPFAFACHACPAGEPLCTASDLIGGATHARLLAGAGAGSTEHGGLTYVRWQCGRGEYSEPRRSCTRGRRA